MLSTDLSTGMTIGVAIFFGFFVVFAVYLYWWVLRIANYCRSAVEFVQSENKRAVSLRRIAEIEATLTELSDSYDALLTSHKKLRSRIGMRRIRKDAHDAVDSVPAPSDEAGRAAYKAKLRETAKQKGLLR